MRKLFFAVAGLFFVNISISQNYNVLFIGNSYTEVNNLPLLINNVANSTGDTITYRSNTPGGCTFNQHCSNQSMNLIRQGGWDFVVLQEQSQFPSFPDSQVNRECLPFAKRLVDSIRANNTCAEPVFYMTWGRKNGDPDPRNVAEFPPLGTYRGMDSLLCLRYMMMKNSNNASVSPVGRVWHYIRDNYPGIELYSSDESHPSEAGSYAAACSFYTIFFHKDPRNITYNGSIPTSVADTIKKVAKLVVYDSLSKWLQATPNRIANQPVAAFDTVSTGNRTYSFTNTSMYAEHYAWDFGDGMNSYVENPSHTFAADGIYKVTLIAAACHVEDTFSMELEIPDRGGEPPVSVSMTEAVKQITVYPNPVGNILYVSGLKEVSALRLITADGKVIQEIDLPEETEKIDVDSCKSGVIFLKFTMCDGSEFTRKVVKQ